jgi:hypothetical protein
VLVDRQWIVKEDHDSIAREALKGAVVRRHQLAQHAVVLAQDVGTAPLALCHALLLTWERETLLAAGRAPLLTGAGVSGSAT